MPHYKELRNTLPHVEGMAFTAYGPHGAFRGTFGSSGQYSAFDVLFYDIQSFMLLGTVYRYMFIFGQLLLRKYKKDVSTYVFSKRFCILFVLQRSFFR